MATSRPNRESRARYTSPMPPAPSGETISYGPTLVPEEIPILASHYSPRNNAAFGAIFSAAIKLTILSSARRPACLKTNHRRQTDTDKERRQRWI